MGDGGGGPFKSERIAQANTPKFIDHSGVNISVKVGRPTSQAVA